MVAAGVLGWGLGRTGVAVPGIPVAVGAGCGVSVIVGSGISGVSGGSVGKGVARGGVAVGEGTHAVSSRINATESAIVDERIGIEIDVIAGSHSANQLDSLR